MKPTAFCFIVFWVQLATIAGIAHAANHRVIPTTWKIDGQTRTGVVAIPPIQSLPKAQSQTSPVVIVYHGHGGNAKRMVRRDFHSHWPEAIVVYPQGLPSPTSRDPDGERPGWQNRAGISNDRDLKLFDAILKSLRGDYKVDDRRIFATGHSNGGGMTALLWAMRHDQFAGVAISAGGSGEKSKLKPLPVFHLAGRKDTIVPFANQERSIAWFKTVNAVTPGRKKRPGMGIAHASSLGTEVVTHIHDGGHELISDAPERIMRFFKMLERPAEGYPINPKLDASNAQRDDASMQARFKAADKNGDGKVSADELPMPKLFQRLDRNRDGFVTRDELPAS